MLKLTKIQFDEYEEKARRDWDDRTGLRLKELYPDFLNGLGCSKTDVQKFARIARKNAAHYQVFDKRDVFKIVVVSMSLGAHFVHDPRLKTTICHSLDQHELGASHRVERLVGYCSHWLDKVWLGQSLDAIWRNVLAALQLQNSSRDCLEAFQREYTDALPASFFNLFADTCLDHACRYGLQTPHQQSAYICLSAVHGVYWFDDPLLTEFRSAVEKAISSEALQQNLTILYERFV